jgi:hypothetical protein
VSKRWLAKRWENTQAAARPYDGTKRRHPHHQRRRWEHGRDDARGHTGGSPADKETGEGSLFGLVVHDGAIYYVDDGDNTLRLLHIAK